MSEYTLFPQLIAGPIIKYKDLDGQLEHRDHTVEKFASGVQRFTIGACKKVLLAIRPRLTRLPPRGKYRYSRNQLPREMCQRRQNSLADLAKASGAGCRSGRGWPPSRC